MIAVLTKLMTPITGRSPAVYGAFLLADDTAVTGRGKRIILALVALGHGGGIGWGIVIWELDALSHGGGIGGETVILIIHIFV